MPRISALQTRILKTTKPWTRSCDASFPIAKWAIYAVQLTPAIVMYRCGAGGAIWTAASLDTKGNTSRAPVRSRAELGVPVSRPCNQNGDLYYRWP